MFAAGTASSAILESTLGKPGLITLNSYLVSTILILSYNNNFCLMFARFYVTTRVVFSDGGLNQNLKKLLKVVHKLKKKP